VKRSLLAALTASLLVGALVVQGPPAHADSFVGGTECKVHFNVWPSPVGTATCTGNLLAGQNAVGAGLDGGRVFVCVPLSAPCTLTMNLNTYSTLCFPAGIQPPASTFTGSFTVTQWPNSSTFDFSMVTVGTAFVFVPAVAGESAGVGAFVPLQLNLGNCLSPAPLDAEMVFVPAADNAL
jgi:hypothetical protein